MNAALDADDLLTAAMAEVPECDRLRVLADIHDGRDQPEPWQLESVRGSYANAPLTDEALIQTATEHSDYRVRREAAFALYQRGLRAGVEIANAAIDRTLMVKP